MMTPQHFAYYALTLLKPYYLTLPAKANQAMTQTELAKVASNYCAANIITPTLTPDGAFFTLLSARNFDKRHYGNCCTIARPSES